MKLVIDSSVFVAAFREEEPHSREAFHILEKLEDETMSAVIPVSVILEVVAAIRRRTGDNDLAREFGLSMITLDQEMAEIARKYVEVLDAGSF